MFKLKTKIKKNRGMTYVELIVVLSIFAIMSGVTLFNYRTFQAKIDIKNLASDIAQQIAMAQKDAIAGKLPSIVLGNSNYSEWNPAYGVYFDVVNNPKGFIYFADTNTYNFFDPLFTFNNGIGCNGEECIDRISINKNNIEIKNLKINDGNCNGDHLNNLSVIFRRPDSSAIVSRADVNVNAVCSGFSDAEIYVSSPEGANATIKIYPSGRIQIAN